MTKPILDKLAKEFREDVNFKAINSDENQQLIQELKVIGIPTVLLIQNGKITGRFTGAQPEATYRQMFESLAEGKLVSIPISPLTRILRLGIGTATMIFALQSSTLWLLTLGVIILFLGVYDRCPVWSLITGYFSNRKKTS